MTAETIVRTLHSTDLIDVARVHQRAFPGSALTHLGLDAVRRYYEWQLTGPHDVLALGAFQDDDLVGFCFGGVFRGALSGFVKKNLGFLIGRVLTHPWLIYHSDFRSRLKLGLVAAGFLKTKHRMSGQLVARGNSFGILSIGVSPQVQGSGVGKKLMNACELFARDRQFDRMRLTVHTNNQQAIFFYSALGWEKDDTEQSWHGKMYKVIKNGREPL